MDYPNLVADGVQYSKVCGAQGHVDVSKHGGPLNTSGRYVSGYVRGSTLEFTSFEHCVVFQLQLVDRPPTWHAELESESLDTSHKSKEHLDVYMSMCLY